MAKKGLGFHKKGNGESAEQFADRMNAKFGEKVELGELLTNVYNFLARFVCYPSEHAHVAHVLWIAHAHLMDAWESTPRLAFLSPEPASGKTRALEITELLVPNAVQAINVRPAYLFRKVGDDNAKPTILYDEIDTVFGPKAKENEEIRGLLNAGHRRGAVAGRCVVRGKIIETEDISAYCAVALAGLGWLPDTRGAAVALVAAAAEREPSLGIRLLSDLRDIFGKTEQQMTTAVILERLHGLSEAPWNDLKGRPLNDRGLATRLRQYGVKSRNLSIGGEYGPRPKGYTREDLHDAWERYLVPSPPSPDRSATAATGATKPDFQGSAVAAVADAGSAVADDGGEENADESSSVAAVADVAAVAGNGEDEEVF